MNRPEQCAAVLGQMRKMQCSTPGVVVVNGGDTQKYWDMVFPVLPDGWVLDVGETNVGLVPALNRSFEAYSNAPWYGFIGDDEFVETPEFDKKLIKATGDWNVSHGDDGFHNGKRAQGYLVIGGKLARAVGYLAIPECWHWFGLDNMWESLASSGVCKKIFVPEVKIDHRHPYQGKGSMDATYDLGLSRKDIDQQEYFNWLRYKIGDVVERVKRARDAG